MSEYHLSMEQAMWEFPVAKAFVILPARARRLGISSPEGEYVHQAGLRARRAMRKHLRENFTIVPMKAWIEKLRANQPSTPPI
jgi:hypothetical protein